MMFGKFRKTKGRPCRTATNIPSPPSHPVEASNGSGRVNAAPTRRQAPPARGREIIEAYVDHGWDLETFNRLQLAKTEAATDAKQRRSPVPAPKPYSLVPGGHTETVAVVSKPEDRETVSRLITVRDAAARRRNARFSTDLNLLQTLAQYPEPQKREDIYRLPEINKTDDVAQVMLEMLRNEEENGSYDKYEDKGRTAGEPEEKSPRRAEDGSTTRNREWRADQGKEKAADESKKVCSDDDSISSESTRSAKPASGERALIDTSLENQYPQSVRPSASLSESSKSPSEDSTSSSSSHKSDCPSDAETLIDSYLEDQADFYCSSDDEDDEEDEHEDNDENDGDSLSPREAAALTRLGTPCSQDSDSEPIDDHPPDKTSSNKPPIPAPPHPPLRPRGRYHYTTTGAARRFDYISTYLSLEFDARPLDILLMLIHFRRRAAQDAAQDNPAFLRAALDIDWTAVLDDMPDDDALARFERHLVASWLRYDGGRLFRDRRGFLAEFDADAAMSWPALVAREDLWLSRKPRYGLRDDAVFRRVHGRDGPREGERRRRWVKPPGSRLRHEVLDFDDESSSGRDEGPCRGSAPCPADDSDDESDDDSDVENHADR